MLLEEIYLGVLPRLVLKYLRFIFEVGDWESTQRSKSFPTDVLLLAIAISKEIVSRFVGIQRSK